MLSTNTFEVSEPEQLLLIEHTVDLWIVTYEEAGNVAPAYRDLLSADELERAERFRFDHLRDFYTFCRGNLRLILSRYLTIPPHKIKFRYGDKGKPYLPNEQGLQFNVSHSSNLFVCAVSKGLTLGIDVEAIQPISDMASIANHFFAPAEQLRLASIADTERTHAFYECWTRKEAVIKATGEGISRSLHSFEVAFGPGAMAQLVRIDNDISPAWHMQSFEPRPGYVGALTSPTPWHSLRLCGEIEELDLVRSASDT